MAVSAWSGLADSLSHRSFAELTTQTQVHHNKFAQQPVYRETQEPRSHTASIGADMTNTAFFSRLFFYFVETAISTAAEWNRCALSSLMTAEIGYRHGQFVGGMYSTPLYKLYSHLYAEGMNMLDLKYDLGKAVKMAISDPSLTF